MLNILINKFIKHGKSLQRTKVNKGKWVSRFSVFFFFFGILGFSIFTNPYC